MSWNYCSSILESVLSVLLSLCSVVALALTSVSVVVTAAAAAATTALLSTSACNEVRKAPTLSPRI